MATHSSILAWKIPWTEETTRLQSLGLQRVTHDWMAEHAYTIIRVANYHTTLISELGWTESRVTSDTCSRLAFYFSPTVSTGLSDSPRWELKERSLCGSSNASWRVDNRDWSSVLTRQLQGVKDWFPSQIQIFKVRESIPRQVDKSGDPQGERGLEFSRRRKGQTFSSTFLRTI